MKPFALTTGEPAGIGPDLIALCAPQLKTQPIVLIGDADVISARGKQLNQDVPLTRVGLNDLDKLHFDGSCLYILHQPVAAPVTAGQLRIENVDYVLDMLRTAISLSQQGTFAGVITAPIHKGIINESGLNFSGHTEYFAELTQTPLPVMLLMSETLKVALLTTHLPLAKVPDAITAESLTATLHVIHHDFRRFFATDHPYIGVCGLNPHAGEQGHLGREEADLINPTLMRLQNQGLKLSEALPADTLFLPDNAKQYDVILAMYHDQGLPVIKSQAFDACANVTLGLPFIRTSVDHGTALPLAGTGKIQTGSLLFAIKTALMMQQHEKTIQI